MDRTRDRKVSAVIGILARFLRQINAIRLGALALRSEFSPRPGPDLTSVLFTLGHGFDPAGTRLRERRQAQSVRNNVDQTLDGVSLYLPTTPASGNELLGLPHRPRSWC